VERVDAVEACLATAPRLERPRGLLLGGRAERDSSRSRRSMPTG